MPESEELVPVFIPPLAAMLARAEEVKGSRLTESEVMRIRDHAVCMTMPVGQAEKMVESRGYRDVEPENCWADWHRLRVQMTGNGYLPKIVLCLLGGPDFPKQAKRVLQEEGVEHEFREHDERMVTSFEASAFRADPSLEPEDFGQIGSHTAALYVLSKNFSSQEGPVVSHAFLRLGRRLLEAGGIAMKCESSGIAHSRSRWIELDDQADRTDSRSDADECSWAALFRAHVQMPIQDDDDLYTCGMHLLGKPDFIVSTRLLLKAGYSSDSAGLAAVDLFSAFGGYLLAECPEGHFASGHTFRMDQESPRFRVTWEECTGYEEDKYFFNPFGRWRFTKRVK